MINVNKGHNAKTSVDRGLPKRGHRGRVEAWFERGPEGVEFHTLDVGNYGTLRHSSVVLLSEEEFLNCLSDARSLAQGKVQTTRLEDDEVETVEDTAEFVETTAEEVTEGIASSVAPFAGSEVQPEL